jgi:nucleoside-triphosphatase
MASRILLSGRPGVGKTTVIREVVAAGAVLAGGFLTEEIRESGRRVGFAVRDIHSGREGILASAARKGSPRVGKYGVDVASFDRVGVGALREAMDRLGCIVIDEIGKMELCSPVFREAVAEATDSDHPILATVPIYHLAFVEALRARSDVEVIQVTPSNRDALPARLIELLRPAEQAGA